MKALRVIGHVVRKEFLQVLRDHQMVRIILLMPVVMLLLLGYAVTVDVKHLPLRVLDYDHSPESRQLIERFRFHETFDLTGGVAGPVQVREALDAGTATAVLVLPAGLGRSLGRLETVRVQILLDGVDSNAALIAYAHARGIVEDFTLDFMRDRLQGEPIPDLMPRVQIFYNPEMESRFYMVPGIVVMLLTMLTSILTGLGLVREREQGTLEQLSVTPIRSWQLMLGKTLPFVVIAFFVLAVALSVVLLWYRVPMRGSWLLLIVFALLFLLNTLSLGLLISTIAHSQQQALFMAWFVNVFAIIMSGFFFPIANMPLALQRLTLLNPVRYFLAIVRELFLKGSGIEAFPLETLGLLVLGPLAITLAALRFTKRAR
jgi:ABC-2 type transport system permease protein